MFVIRVNYLSLFKTEPFTISLIIITFPILINIFPIGPIVTIYPIIRKTLRIKVTS